MESHIIELPEHLQIKAETRWRDLQKAAADIGLSAPDLPERSGPVLALSDFIAVNLTRSPRLFVDLVESADLNRGYSATEFADRLTQVLAGIDSEDDLNRNLRLFRRREMIRIAWRDLAGWAELEETVTELSDLADAVIDQAYQWLYDRYCDQFGTPTTTDGKTQGLIALGLGKLGARELNFSSDVDLIFAFPQSGSTAGGEKTLRNEEFFLKLCRRLISILGQPTAEGFCFRIDLRLRPFGDSGPMVLSFDALEQYYQDQGRDWERYAWIKARVVAGDLAAGDELLKRLQPFVYRRYLDYGAYEALRAMKQMITLEVARKRLQANIKIGPGGIREIEFFGQIFQLIRGGVVPDLQQRRIRKVLEVLAHDGYIPNETYLELDSAYVFLRRTENRLQEFDDQQTHQLPAKAENLTRLAVSMQFSDTADFETTLAAHRDNVHRHFQMLLETGTAQGPEKAAGQQLAAVWQSAMGSESALKILAAAGYRAPEQIITLLSYLRADGETRSLSAGGRQRLDRLMPVLLKEIGGCDQPDQTLQRIVELIKSIERRTSYLALLLEHPAARAQLIRLSSASPWLASFLARHPVLLDELLYPNSLAGPPKTDVLNREIDRRLGQVEIDDLEAQIEALCIFKQVNVLQVAAADIGGTLPLMRVSDHLSAIAETTVQRVVDLAWHHLVSKHGRPAACLGEQPCERGFAVIAYGKLGGLELGYGSDLDLVFLHAGSHGTTDGNEKPIDNSQFYNRLGQRVIHLLTAHTRAGRAYEIDMRLRPSGNAGVLVSHIDRFQEYQLEDAWTFEHQALIKARPICGDAVLTDGFASIRRRVLEQPRGGETLKKDVIEMRRRMRAELLKPVKGLFDLKQGIGGMVDIEFLVQYLVLRHSENFAGLTQWTDNVRLLQALSQTEIIHENTAHLLKHAYLIYRAVAHKLSLQEAPAQTTSGKYKHLQKRVREIWQGVFGQVD